MDFVTIDHAKKMEEEIIEFSTLAKGNLYFFGSGEYCEKMLSWFRARNLILPIAIFDNDPKKCTGGV